MTKANTKVAKPAPPPAESSDDSDDSVEGKLKIIERTDVIT